jgi:hypothetical protein
LVDQQMLAFEVAVDQDDLLRRYSQQRFGMLHQAQLRGGEFAGIQ